MGVSLAETPPSVKLRVWENQGRYYILQRDGEGWESITDFPTRKEALGVIERHFANKVAKWSFEVKTQAGWVCEQQGCGELDKKLLEAHHIHPREQFPEEMYDLNNGKCLCVFHHAAAHTGWARLTIMARGFLILLARLNPHQKAEIQRMAV